MSSIIPTNPNDSTHSAEKFYNSQANIPAEAANSKSNDLVIEIAKKYIDFNAFLWKGDPVSSYADSSGPSDFKLRFWKTGASVPSAILERVNSEIEQAAEHKEEKGNKLRMCCYEFAFLILQKAGVVTEEQINDVIHIGAVSYRATKLDPSNTLVYQPEALMGGSWENTKEITKESYPSPGDVILAKRADGRVKHVLISCGLNQFYELEDGKFGKLDLSKSRFMKSYLESFRWVPLSEVSNNVQNFIKQNYSLLALEGSTLYDEQNFKNQIKASRYEDFG